jgi:hypothetical protein
MNDYPRELNLDVESEQKLRSYLTDELTKHSMERQRYVDDLIKHQEDYWADPKEEVKTFPFTGACNLIVPLTAIAVETVHSKMMTTIFGLEQLVTIKGQTPEWQVIEKEYERYFDRDLKRNVKIRNFVDNTNLENTKYGNCVGKAYYEKITKTAIREDKEIDVVIKRGSCADSVALARFLMPFTETNPQLSPWVGEEHIHTPEQILQMELDGYFIEGTYEKLKNFYTPSGGGGFSMGGNRFDTNQRDLENKTPVFPRFIEWQEIWLGFNVDKHSQNKLREIVVYFHNQSGTICSIRDNWNEDLHRPYRIGKYFPIEHRWTGIGICKQNSQFQLEITIQHRQRIDNVTLANTRMIKINKLAGYGPKEPIFPGKMWFVDDITHIDVMQLGEVYTSAFNQEQSTLMYSQQRTNVNDRSMGMPQTGTPDTATNSVAMIQESKGRFDYYLHNYKEFLSEIITDVAVVNHQFGPRNVQWIQEQQDGPLLLQAIQLPESAIRDGLFFNIAVVGATNNNVVDRQSWMQVSEMLQKYFTGIMELSQALQNPNLIQIIARKGITSASEALRQMVESYGFRNIDKIVLTDKEIMEALTQPPPNPQLNGSNSISRNFWTRRKFGNCRCYPKPGNG